MKKVLFILLAGSGLLCSWADCQAKDSREHITREFTITSGASQNTLYIYNISGYIKVEGYSGDKVIIEADKTISADSDQDLETGKKEFRLGFDQSNDSITAYIAGPFDTRPGRNRKNFDNGPEYGFNVDFTVKVPSGMNLQVSTVTGGNIEINNVDGRLHANNVSDGISITNAKRETKAHTVSGDVNVVYAANPSEESSYETVSGDISVTYRSDLSADLSFKSMNGSFYTDFPEAQLLPVAAEKVREKKGQSFIYRLSRSTTVRFGKGGKSFRFETLNGNVYIKKQS